MNIILIVFDRISSIIIIVCIIILPEEMWYRVKYEYTIYANLLVHFSSLYYSLIVYINAALEINMYKNTYGSFNCVSTLEQEFCN